MSFMNEINYKTYQKNIGICVYVCGFIISYYADLYFYTHNHDGFSPTHIPTRPLQCFLACVGFGMVFKLIFLDFYTSLVC